MLISNWSVDGKYSFTSLPEISNIEISLMLPEKSFTEITEFEIVGEIKILWFEINSFIPTKILRMTF